MIIVSNGVLRFTDDKPKWWTTGTAVQYRKNRTTPGAWVLFKKLGEGKVGSTIGPDGSVILTDIPDGHYDVMKHSSTSIMLVPNKDFDGAAEEEQPQEEPQPRPRTLKMPNAPRFESCSDVEFDLYILNVGKALQSQGRFSAGFPGWANIMSERFARFKMNKQGGTKRLGEAEPELDYYEQMMKIVSDPTVTDAVKIRALKELQQNKPKSKIKRNIQRIVVPD